jgi:hypothetical protein
MFDEIHFSDLGLARRGSIFSVSLKPTEVLPMISRRSSALNQVAQNLIIEILMIYDGDPNNIMMQTGSLIASTCVVRVQNGLTVPSSPTAWTDERLGGSHAETPDERIPRARPWG